MMTMIQFKCAITIPTILLAQTAMMLPTFGESMAVARILNPEVTPVADKTLNLQAKVSYAWREGDVQYIWLEQPTIGYGAHDYQCQQAFIRIETNDDNPSFIAWLKEAHITSEENSAWPEVVLSGELESGLALTTAALHESAPAPAVIASATSAMDALLNIAQSTAVEPTSTDELAAQADKLSTAEANTTTAAQTPLPLNGRLQFHTGRTLLETDPETSERRMYLLDGVQLLAFDTTTQEHITLQAANAIVFFKDKSETINSSQNALPLENIEAIYLNGNVECTYRSTDNLVTIHADEFWLSQKSHSQIHNARVQLTGPRNSSLTLRAEALQMMSRQDFILQEVQVSNSRYAKPDVALHTNRLELSRQPNHWRVNSDNITVGVAEVPTLWLPSVTLSGNPEIIGDITASYDSDTGMHLETSWHLFPLLQRETSPGTNAELHVDLIGNHGLGLGLTADWERNDRTGDLNVYTLIDDEGQDDIAQRLPREHDGDTRGWLRMRHRSYLDRITPGLDVTLLAHWASDSTILEEIEPRFAYTEPAWTTGIRSSYRNAHSLASLRIEGILSEQLDQPGLNYAPGHSQERAEIRHRIASAPVLQNHLVWNSDTSLGAIHSYAGNDTPAARQLLNLTGYPAYTTWDRTNKNNGIPTGWIQRFDTRQEFRAPFSLSDWHISPWLMARGTAWDNKFEGYAGNNQHARLTGGAGIDVHTTFSSETLDVRSELFGLHKLRHTMSPYAQIGIIGSSIDTDEIPVIDWNIEHIQQGAFAQVGVVQHWQTQRGPAGARYTADWIRLKTEAVFWDQADGSLPQTPLYYFDPSKPESSLGDDHIYGEFTASLSETLSSVSDGQWNLNNDRLNTWQTGLRFNQNKRLTWQLGYRELNVLDERLLYWRMEYDISPRYGLDVSQHIDLNDEALGLQIQLERRLPEWTIELYYNQSTIDDNFSVGLRISPR